MEANNEIYVCYTYYHIYISLLEVLYSKKNREVINFFLVLTDHIENVEDIKKKLESEDIYEKIYIIKDLELKKTIRKNFIYCLFYSYFIKKIFFRDYKDFFEFIKNTNFQRVNLFLDSTVTSHFIMQLQKELNLLEDGLLIYMKRKKVLKDYLYQILKIPKRVGRDKKIKRIRVQFPEKLPEDIKYKSIKLDLKKYEETLNLQDKKIIFNIFNIKIDLSKKNTKKCLILTQPISEMGYVSERKKIVIYKKIIERFSEYELYLKKHPRDKTIYPFKVRELDQYFPIEILKLFSIHYFDLIVAIESTAIDNLKEYAVSLNLGYEIDKELFDKVMLDKRR